MVIIEGTSCTCLRYQTSSMLHLAQFQFHRSPWAREPCQQARGKPAFRTFRINWRLHFRRQTIAFQTHLIGQDGLDDALLATLDPPHFLSPLIHLLRLQFQLGLRCENRYQALYGGEVEMMKPLLHFLMQTYQNDNLKAWHKITWDSSTLSTELNTAWTHCCLWIRPLVREAFKNVLADFVR